MGGFTQGFEVGFDPKYRQEQLTRQQGMKDAYRQSEIDRYNKANQNIQQIMASGQIMDPNTNQWRPLTPEERQQLTAAAQHVDSYIKKLYDPHFDPQANGQAAESILHKLTDKLHLTKPPDPAKAKAAGEQMQDLRGIRDKYATLAPGTEELQKGQVKSQVEEQALKAKIDSIPRLFPNASPEEIKRLQDEVIQTSLTGRRQPSWKLYKFPGGTFHYLDINHDEIPEGAQPVSLGSVSHAIKVGSTEDYMTKAYGPNPTPEQIKQGLSEIAQAKSGTTVGTRQVIHDNGDGTATIYEITSSSAKVFPGASKPVPHEKTSPEPSPKETKPQGKGAVGKGGNLKTREKIPGRMPAKLETEKAALEQVKIPVDNLIKALEESGVTEKGGLMDAAKSAVEFGRYKLGAKPEQSRADLIKNAAAVKILGAAPWVTIGRGKYLYEEIQQHLPSPSDSPGLMYDKVKWLRDNLIAPIEKEINESTMRGGQAIDPNPLKIKLPGMPENP